MIKSMTGYGKGNISENLRNYQVEIKSVNHRYLDISVKMPRVLSYLEEDVKKVISSKVKRGKIDVFVTFENSSTEGKEIKINNEIAKMYINQLKQLAEEENILANIEVTEISKYPDVLSVQNTQDDEQIKKELIEATTIATDKLVRMRQVEGSKMAEDLLKRIEKINQKIEKISELSTGLIEEYVVKLRERIQEILKTDIVDETRLAQETVIFADKSSIQEELTRLNSHIHQFKTLLNNEGAIGKKLDFIIQEMNRESNTIASKSVKLEITNLVIEIKTELEDIREQIQNIE